MAHGAQAWRGSTQALGNGAFVAISFSAVNFDTDSFWAVGNPTRLTVPLGLGGQYVISGEIDWASSATGPRELTLRKNGTTTLANLIGPAEAGGTCAQNIVTVAPLVAGDYIELLGNQGSGGSLNTSTQANYSPTLTMSFLGS